MKKYLIIFSAFCASTFSSFAVIPLGYYNSINGKKDATLKTELHNIICQDTTHYLGYGSGAGKTWEGFYSTDRDLITNAVIDMYSPNVRYFPNPNFASFGTTVEIEHSVPKSWWKCDITHPDCPAKDLNHLYPADGPTNASKNDNPLGVVTGIPTKDNGVSKIGPGSYDGYLGTVFEPADQYKGDFARSYFYVATAYEHYVNKWDLTKPENMMANTTYPELKPWAIQLLLQWHRQDPVSEKERTRNEVVFGIQRNRNPFIDFPELVEYIWGSYVGIPYSPSTGTSSQIIEASISPNPAKNTLNITCDQSELSCTIYNTNGILLAQYKLNNPTSISTAELKNGLYFLQINSGSHTSIQKFTILK